MAPFGGWYSSTNSLALQTKMTITMPSGMAVQATSSRVLGWTAGGLGDVKSSDRRRYRSDR